LGTADSWALIRAGYYTRRPFQADQLHVDLWWHGLNLARDAGTYLYNGEPPWDNGLAGTSVHNTVTVDGRDQMRRAGRFLWLDWAQASGRSFSSSPLNVDAKILDTFEGEHDGYRRFGVTHRRRVHFVEEDAWVIVDDLLGNDLPVNGAHELRLHWLLPDLPFTVLAQSPFSGILSAADDKFQWSVFSSSPGSTSVLQGGKKLQENPAGIEENANLLGWESPTYGELRPAISLVHRVNAALPVRMVTIILAGEELQLQARDGNVILSRGKAQVFETSLSAAQESE
jgi:hypothetical protein